MLEHVPDLDSALADSARILVPGGKFIAIFPFAYASEEHVVRARLGEDGIEFLAPPEYHGNPMNTEAGSLVFQLPGWGILDDARRVGFADACIVFWSSMERGFTAGPDLTGILLMVATR